MKSVWRMAFLVGGVLIVIGGFNHPRGAMVDMLADPHWFWSHIVFTLGVVGLLAGLVSFGRTAVMGPTLKRWTRIAVWLTALQTFEAVMHTWAGVDAANLAAGRSTPVLTTHLYLAIAIYPVFGAAIIGFIIAAMRERAVGSPWIGWLGIIGAAAHGLSAPLTLVFEIPWAPILFPMVMFLAFWMVLAAAWPARASAHDGLKPVATA